MAAKDADLAYDYSAQVLVPVDDDVAGLAVVLADEDVLPDHFEELFLVDVGIASGGGVTYRMRAHDTTLGRYVYWAATEVDSAGASYVGPGPLTDIVVQNIIGQV